MEEVEMLGPLKALVGEWEGDKGYDVAPATPDPENVAESAFHERIVFEPTGRVDNHQQVLYGLRYRTTAWRRHGEPSFHEELGYWLYDADRDQVMRCFMVPRGVTVIAGGTVRRDAKRFELKAELGSTTYGICSNRFLDEEFRTERYELVVTIHDDGTWSYEEDTVLRIKGQEALFHHTDRNTLRRAAGGLRGW